VNDCSLKLSCCATAAAGIMQLKNMKMWGFMAKQPAAW
jgi:hypothetical protein